MRVLLDENIPADFAAELAAHSVETVRGLGWTGVRNGELLRRAAGLFDVLVTMDRNLEFQQPIAKQPFGVIILIARSNRIDDLTPLVSALLSSVAEIASGELRRVGA